MEMCAASSYFHPFVYKETVTAALVFHLLSQQIALNMYLNTDYLFTNRHVP